MDNNKKSLVSKIVGKGVITPYEAIHLQHLNEEHRKQQIENLQLSENIYEDYENLQPLVPDYLLKQLLAFTQKQDADLYDSYRWAGNDLMSLEHAIGEIGYRGLSLLNEFRYARAEWCTDRIVDIDLKRPLGVGLMEFKVYSRVCQKRITSADILGLLGTTLAILMQSIDIILTDNYYLKNLYEPEDLNCIRYLKMWIKEDDYEGLTFEEKMDQQMPMNLIKACFEHGDLNFIVENNHPKIIGLMKNKLDSFGISLSSSFEQNSLDYVKETVKNVVARSQPSAFK